MKIKLRDIYVPKFMREDMGMAFASAKEGGYDYILWNGRILRVKDCSDIGVPVDDSIEVRE